MNCGQLPFEGPDRDDLAAAMARFGGGDWMDLSGTASRHAWPIESVPLQFWRNPPTGAARQTLIRAAAARFGCDPARLLPVPGMALAMGLTAGLVAGLVAGLRRPGRAMGANGDCSNHAARLQAAGWQVDRAADIAQMRGAELAVIVNPGNPDGREYPAPALADLAGSVGYLVVDESFADARPDLTMAADTPDNVLILRDLSQFYGLAGLGLAFVIATPALCRRLAATGCAHGIGGPALQIGAAALRDRSRAEDLRIHLTEASLQLDRLALAAGWRQAGGTHLFRLYRTPEDAAAQAMLTRARIWVRLLDCGLRLAIPASRDEWQRLRSALRP